MHNAACAEGWKSISEAENLEKRFEKAFGRGSLRHLEDIREQLATGRLGGKIHNLGNKGGVNLTGWKAIDVPGTGNGRGQGRVVFREVNDGTIDIEIRGIIKGHDYTDVIEN